MNDRGSNASGGGINYNTNERGSNASNGGINFFNNERDGISNGYDLLGNSVCVPIIKMVADRLVRKLYAK